MLNIIIANLNEQRKLFRLTTVKNSAGELVPLAMIPLLPQTPRQWLNGALLGALGLVVTAIPLLPQSNPYRTAYKQAKGAEQIEIGYRFALWQGLTRIDLLNDNSKLGTQIACHTGASIAGTSGAFGTTFNCCIPPLRAYIPQRRRRAGFWRRLFQRGTSFAAILSNPDLIADRIEEINAHNDYRNWNVRIDLAKRTLG